MAELSEYKITMVTLDSPPPIGSSTNTVFEPWYRQNSFTMSGARVSTVAVLDDDPNFEVPRYSTDLEQFLVSDTAFGPDLVAAGNRLSVFRGSIIKDADGNRFLANFPFINGTRGSFGNMVGGRKAILISGDVALRAHCIKAVARTVKELGGLDVLVNNAAFQVHSTKFEDLTPEHFDATLKTNLYGYFNMAQAAVAHMRPGSAIVNTGSVTGIEGSKELVDYSMTKGGIHAFTRALSGNLLSKGIRVNAVAPGPVWTPLNPSDRQAGDVSKFGGDTPMRRPAQPEEIAPAYVFLASPQCSSYITGEILPIIGGY